MDYDAIFFTETGLAKNTHDRLSLAEKSGQFTVSTLKTTVAFCKSWELKSI